MKRNIYLPLLLLFILADVMCDNFLVKTFNNNSPLQQLILLSIFLVLQILASPIQAGFSDFYCRKKSLVISLTFSLFSLIVQFFYTQEILFFFSTLILMIVLKGTLGNTTPLSLAAIADTQTKNIRFSFALSTGSFALAYLILINFNKFLSNEQANIAMSMIYLTLIYFSIFHFKDIRDNKSSIHQKISRSSNPKMDRWKLILNDINLIIHELQLSHTRNALLSFLLWEISLYSILLLYIDFNVSRFSIVSLAMVFGYIFGVLILNFCKKIHDKTIIKLGYNISAVSLIPFFILYIFSNELDVYVLSGCYFFHMVGNAFLSAALFSLLANEREFHEQGKIYGLISSVDTVSFMLSLIAVIIYNTFNLNPLYIISFSFLAVAVSWFPYAKFERTKHRTVKQQ
ncbi:MAG: MFS transporter [Parachlamydiales bacterium]|nr:MFS transporter [Verrucomicrobiota bacterium]MBX3718724.1 MFS transporter [Candidatus Acheromyda pituitae]